MEGAVEGPPPDVHVLVVAPFVPSPSGPLAERRAAQLVTDLAALVAGGRVTVLALDGRGARRSAPALVRRGADVVTGPEDWHAWLRSRPLAFSHLVVTDLAAHRRLGAVLAQTQPQAYRILALPSLPFEDVKAARPHRGAADGPAADLVAAVVREHLAGGAEDFDAAWCATPRDRDWLATTAPALRCAVVPTAAAPGPDVAFERRTGYVVLATPGADLAAGHEDAARHAVAEVLPRLLACDPTAFLRIVVDEPSPGVQLLAGAHVELVAAGGDPARWFRRSRVALAVHPRGTGPRDVIALALDTGTPLVASAAATAGRGLGRLAGLVAADGAGPAALRAGELHRRRAAWFEVHDELARLAAGPFSAGAARLKLLRACADAGLAPAAGVARAQPLDPPVAAGEHPVRPTRVPVAGSAWKAAPPAPDTPAPAFHGPPSGDWTDVDVNDQYGRWCARYGPTRARLDRLAARLSGLVRRPTVSVVMPVFDTDPSWLHDAISSVRAQVYEEWELCIGDDGSTNPATLEVLHAHLGQDPRIRLVRLPARQGIVGASNAALALATGELVALLDHDDELKPHALGEVVLALDERPSLDVVYTDEDKRDPDGRLVDPFFKPDWSPDHLMSRNYLCHLLVVRRTLLDKLGGFRPGYDGSQDYDLVLRATEATTEIGHVAEPLYTWRKVEGSTAAVSDAKPWALDAARRALADAMDRRGAPGRVVDGLHPTTYRARYAVRGRPRVSVIIPTRDRADLLRGCIDDVLERSGWDDVELIVVDNQSTDPETLGYLAGVPALVLRYPYRFHYPRMMNLAAHEAAGDFLLFLNNDTRVVNPDWIEALVEHGQRPEVGVVGARLRYPD
ncbi:MAG: glycosyltransferase, partial [Acidimicrobiia bacterium]